MADLTVHHVSIVVTDLERSIAFYQAVFGLGRVPRPPFAVGGAWLTCGEGRQIHLVDNPGGTYRRGRRIDIADTHFAFNTSDFEGFIGQATAYGFREDLPEDDPLRMFVIRNGVAGFPQVYLLDPDANEIEVNGAAFG